MTCATGQYTSLADLNKTRLPSRSKQKNIRAIVCVGIFYIRNISRIFYLSVRGPVKNRCTYTDTEVSKNKSHRSELHPAAIKLTTASFLQIQLFKRWQWTKQIFKSPYKYLVTILKWNRALIRNIMSLRAPPLLSMINQFPAWLYYVIVSLESHRDVCIIYDKFINLETTHAPMCPVPQNKHVSIVAPYCDGRHCVCFAWKKLSTIVTVQN